MALGCLALSLRVRPLRGFFTTRSRASPEGEFLRLETRSIPRAVVWRLGFHRRPESLGGAQGYLVLQLLFGFRRQDVAYRPGYFVRRCSLEKAGQNYLSNARKLGGRLLGHQRVGAMEWERVPLLVSSWSTRQTGNRTGAIVGWLTVAQTSGAGARNGTARKLG
jgi:hypothetical protein